MHTARTDRARIAVVIAFFGLQVLGVVRARWADDRYFAWAPLHEVTELRIDVVDAGRRLDLDAIRARYAIPRSALAARGTILRELNDVRPLLARIERIECARPVPGVVRIAFRRNGREGESVIRCER